MTELAESIAIGAIQESSDDMPCWYCSEEPLNDNKENKEDDDPESKLGEGEEEVPENDERNLSSILAGNLGSEPKWTISNPDKSLRSDNQAIVKVTPAAHHCIPGKASLKRAEELLTDFMRKDGQYNHICDIGYDVNAAENGVWLAGNYYVRKKNGWGKTWSACAPAFQDKYAERAMDKANCQFHDAHEEYSDHVLATLQSICNKLKKLKKKNANCPICGKDMKGKKNRPPYGLVGRLNFVSSQYRGLLTPISGVKKKNVQNGYFTSAMVKTYFGL